MCVYDLHEQIRDQGLAAMHAVYSAKAEACMSSAQMFGREKENKKDRLDMTERLLAIPYLHVDINIIVEERSNVIVFNTIEFWILFHILERLPLSEH